MKQIRVVIIDDERSAREEIKLTLLQFTDFCCIGEGRNATEAKILIEQKKPDLIFLDIQMPEKSGFELLESLDITPEVIFTTAYNQYAIQAFEVNALDYLMKPIRAERFIQVIHKVRTLFQLKNDLHHAKKMYQRIFIKDGEKRFLIRYSDIFLIQSLEDYSQLHFQNQKAIQRKSLRQWEVLLNTTMFFRINRKEIINLNYIKRITPNNSGRLTVTLNTGETLEVSTRQSSKLKALNLIK